MSQAREQQVARAFVSLADTLVADYDVIELLTRLVGDSVELLDADAGGIMLADPHGQLRVVAASSEVAQLIELMQVQNDQGPCLDCYRTATPVSAPDLARAADRWPLFVAAAMNQSVFNAVHALPLRLRGQAIGALNLWRHQAGPMAAEELALGQALADVATVAILQERAIRRAEVLNEQLQAALNSRVIIEQAKGVLSQHGRLDMNQAFDLLRRYARFHNRRLAEVARELADRTLDPGAVRSPSNGPA
jgi:transcriptional regulator with GAF, ATPase, and Fis domain